MIFWDLLIGILDFYLFFNLETTSNTTFWPVFLQRRYNPTNIEFVCMPSRHQSLTRHFSISEDNTPSAISLDTYLLLRISKCIALCRRNSCHHVIVGSHVEKDLYSATNDPQTGNDPQIGPQMIPNRKWSPPENNEWHGFWFLRFFLNLFFFLYFFFTN